MYASWCSGSLLIPVQLGVLADERARLHPEMFEEVVPGFAVARSIVPGVVRDVAEHVWHQRDHARLGDGVGGCFKYGRCGGNFVGVVDVGECGEMWGPGGGTGFIPLGVQRQNISWCVGQFYISCYRVIEAGKLRPALYFMVSVIERILTNST